MDIGVFLSRGINGQFRTSRSKNILVLNFTQWYELGLSPVFKIFWVTFELRGLLHVSLSITVLLIPSFLLSMDAIMLLCF